MAYPRSSSQLALTVVTAATASVSALMYMYRRKKQIRPSENQSAREQKVWICPKSESSCQELVESPPPLAPIFEDTDEDSKTGNSSIGSTSDPKAASVTPANEDTPALSDVVENQGPDVVLLDPELLFDKKEAMVIEKTEVRVRRVRGRSLNSDAVMMITQEDLMMMNELMQLETDEEKEYFDSYSYDRKYSSSRF